MSFLCLRFYFVADYANVNVQYNDIDCGARVLNKFIECFNSTKITAKFVNIHTVYMSDEHDRTFMHFKEKRLCKIVKKLAYHALCELTNNNGLWTFFINNEWSLLIVWLLW